MVHIDHSRLAVFISKRNVQLLSSWDERSKLVLKKTSSAADTNRGNNISLVSVKPI